MKLRCRAGKPGKDEQREIIKQLVHDLQYHLNLKRDKAKGNEENKPMKLIHVGEHPLVNLPGLMVIEEEIWPCCRMNSQRFVRNTMQH